MAAALENREDRRRRLIAEAAYYRAEQRGFDGGDPVSDWLAAEAEIDARLNERGPLVELLEERLATASERLETVKAKLAGMTAEAREEWRHDVERLARLRNSFRQRLDEAREHGAEAGGRVEQRAEQIWEEISEALKRLGAVRRRRATPGAAAEPSEHAPSRAGRPAAKTAKRKKKATGKPAASKRRASKPPPSKPHR